jgi:hypothetical protein
LTPLICAFCGYRTLTDIFARRMPPISSVNGVSGTPLQNQGLM